MFLELQNISIHHAGYYKISVDWGTNGNDTWGSKATKEKRDYYYKMESPS